MLHWMCERQVESLSHPDLFPFRGGAADDCCARQCCITALPRHYMPRCLCAQLRGRRFGDMSLTWDLCLLATQLQLFTHSTTAAHSTQRKRRTAHTCTEGTSVQEQVAAHSKGWSTVTRRLCAHATAVQRSVQCSGWPSKLRLISKTSWVKAAPKPTQPSKQRAAGNTTKERDHKWKRDAMTGNTDTPHALSVSGRACAAHTGLIKP